MTDQLRPALAALPFVRENRDRTLNLWAVNPAVDFLDGFNRGRSYAARYLDLVRKHQAPHVTIHVAEAQAAKKPNAVTLEGGTEPTLAGFEFEIAEAVVSAPALASPGSIAARAGAVGRGLPFVQFDNYWSVRPTGCTPQDQATGRHYAALLVREMKAAEDPTLLCLVLRDMRAAEVRWTASEDLRVGFFHAITETAMQATRSAFGTWRAVPVDRAA